MKLFIDSCGKPLAGEFGCSIFSHFKLPDNQNHIDSVCISFPKHDAVMLSMKKYIPSEEKEQIVETNLISKIDEKEVKENDPIMNDITTSSLEFGKNLFQLKIERSPNCPLKVTSKWTKEQLNQLRESISTETRRFDFVQVAVSALVVNTPTNEVLLTRRAKHMRSFPNVFVAPGGGIEECDKDIFESVSRELFEETGLHLTREFFTPIYLWESAFPTTIQQGNPKRHHLVIHFLANVNLFDKDASLKEKYEDLFKLQAEEVEGISWIPINLVELMVNQDNLIESETSVNFSNDYNNTYFDVYLGEGKFEKSPVKVLLSLDSTLGNERVSTGSRGLLKHWFRLKKESR
ncbi:hypothetical protein ABK040_006797 [Willaertia magna]